MTLPAQILILRHGEKPGDPEQNDGGPDLSVRGYERAAALAYCVPDQFGKPDILFATQASKHSNRPRETLRPLAEALGLNIHCGYADGEFGQLAEHILSSGKCAGQRVLVCWHHGEIPALAQALGGLPPESKWPGKIFDRVWRLTYGKGCGQPPRDIAVDNLPQRLLYGDSPQ